MTNTEQIKENELVNECLYAALDKGGELTVPTVKRAIEYGLFFQKQQILDAVEKRKEVFVGGFESDEEAAEFDARNDAIDEILTIIKTL